MVMASRLKSRGEPELFSTPGRLPSHPRVLRRASRYGRLSRRRRRLRADCGTNDARLALIRKQGERRVGSDPIGWIRDLAAPETDDLART